MTDRTHVLLDLDGTLSASEPGIVGSLTAALTTVGLPIPTADVLRSAIGPPFATGLPAIGVPAELVGAVTEHYRTRYGATGLYETALFDGVADMLDALRGAELVLAVATSKPEPNAVRIVEHLGIADAFTVVAGADLETGRADKASVIARALELLDTDAGPHVVMVGDRHHDIDGAREHGIDTVAVGWGYGAVAEHIAARAWAFAPTPADVVSLVVGSGCRSSPGRHPSRFRDDRRPDLS